MAAFGGASEDERAEDAGPRAAQVTEPGCGGRGWVSSGTPGEGVLLNGEDRGDAEPRLVTAGPAA